MPSPLPPGLKSKLTGTLTVEVSPQDNINTRVSRQVTLDLHFSWDHTAVMIGLGWPSIVLDNSAPLSPATTTLNVSLLEARLGSFDPNTGRMELPVVLHLDYTPDYFLGKRDQDVNITLSTQGRGPPLWELSPFIGFEANIEYKTNTFLSSSSVHMLSVHLSGTVSPLPPRATLPQPWSFENSGSFTTSDGDEIDFSIDRQAVTSDVVEFELKLGPRVTWRKEINLPDGGGSSWDIVADGAGASARESLWVGQVNNGQSLTFRKAKFLGRMTDVYSLGDLNGLTPGSRVTFTWVKD